MNGIASRTVHLHLTCQSLYGRYEFNLNEAGQRQGLRELRNPDDLLPYRQKLLRYYGNTYSSKRRRPGC